LRRRKLQRKEKEKVLKEPKKVQKVINKMLLPHLVHNILGMNMFSQSAIF
jgi:hypothetical protein